VDVIIAPPRPTTPYEPPKDPNAQGRSAALKTQVTRAANALDATLDALFYAILGMPSPETSAALRRYFPQWRYRSAEFASTLAGEISHMRAHIDSIHYEEFRTQAQLDTHCKAKHLPGNYELKRFCALQEQVSDENVKLDAFVYPLETPNRIVLFPRWYGHADPASLLVHEAAHLLLRLRGHPTLIPHRNPYAIQGFVAALSSLTAKESDRRYPAPAP
jgi:hypothetical protein